GWRIELLSGAVAAVLVTALAAGTLDEDAAHGLGGEEMPAAVPELLLPPADQPQGRPLDQGRGVERLPWGLAGHPLRGQAARLLVDEREELAGRLPVALLDGVQDAGNFTHRRHQGLENPGGTSSPRALSGSRNLGAPGASNPSARRARSATTETTAE